VKVRTGTPAEFQAGRSGERRLSGRRPRRAMVKRLSESVRELVNICNVQSEDDKFEGKRHDPVAKDRDVRAARRLLARARTHYDFEGTGR